MKMGVITDDTNGGGMMTDLRDSEQNRVACVLCVCVCVCVRARACV